MGIFEDFIAVQDQLVATESEYEQLQAQAAAAKTALENSGRQRTNQRDRAVKDFWNQLAYAPDVYRVGAQLLLGRYTRANPEWYRRETFEQAGTYLNGLNELSEGLEKVKRPMPLAMLSVVDMQITHNPKSLSRPRSQDLVDYKLKGLNAIVGHTVPGRGIDVFEQEQVELMPDKRVLTAEPNSLEIAYTNAIEIHSQTEGHEYDNWLLDPDVRKDESYEISVVNRNRAITVIYGLGKKAVETISMGQAENILLIGRSAVRHADAILEHIVQEDHDDKAVQLVRQALDEQR